MIGTSGHSPEPNIRPWSLLFLARPARVFVVIRAQNRILGYNQTVQGTGIRASAWLGTYGSGYRSLTLRSGVRFFARRRMGDGARRGLR